MPVASQGKKTSSVQQVRVTPSRAKTAASPQASGPQSHQLQQSLLKVIGGSRTRDQALAGVMKILMQTLRPAGMLYCQRNEEQQLAAQPQLSPGATGNIEATYRDGLIELCDDACGAGASQSAGLGLKQHLIAIAAPVLLRGKSPEAIGAMFAKGTVDVDHAIGVLQVIAAHVTLWDVLQATRAAELESQSTAAVLELLGKCKSCADLKQACITLVNELQEFLGCQRVAVGLCGVRQDSCKLEAVSGLSQFDKRSEFASALEAALDEALLRDEITVWPAADEEKGQATLAHRRACDLADQQAIISSPLYDDQDNVVGAWMLLGNKQRIQSEDILDFMSATQRQVGSCLHLLQKLDMNPLARTARNVLSSWQAKTTLLVTCLVVAIMMMPVRYRVGCNCQIQPVKRRFVAAPYDGKLDRTLVEPGDEVSDGDLLAKLEGRELRWELAGLDAEYNRALKSQDAALAIDDVAEAQQAGLEAERLQLKRKLLNNRLANLEVRSPLDGIVITGDLKKTEGAPLSVGQVMFEIAPLDQMIVEVEIPEREILHVAAGMEVVVRVDAYPGKKWLGTIDKIFPKAEMRENESVYLAEVNLDNASGELRPGMKGKAKTIGQRHSLGWNLFHKPYESFCMLIGW